MAKKKDSDLTVPMYQPWTIIQGGKVEEVPDLTPITVVSKSESPKTLYFVAIPEGILGAFSERALLMNCLKDYPNAQVIELQENKRLD